MFISASPGDKEVGNLNMSDNKFEISVQNSFTLVHFQSMWNMLPPAPQLLQHNGDTSGFIL